MQVTGQHAATTTLYLGSNDPLLSLSVHVGLMFACQNVYNILCTYLYYVQIYMTGLHTEVQGNQAVRSQNYQHVKITKPPIPAKRQGSRSQTEMGYQTLPSNFQSLHKAHYFGGHTLSKDSAEDLQHHHILTSELDHCAKATKKRMDDSAIGGSETDSSYDDVDTQQMSSGIGESHGSLSSYDVVSDRELGAYNDSHSLGLPQTQLSGKGYHSSPMKEVEELKNLVHHLSIKVKVL